MDDSAALRRAYRTWVRAHHPDRGGDPDAFAAGLARWRSALAPPAPRPIAGPVVAYRRHGVAGTLLRWWWRRQRAPRVH